MYQNANTDFWSKFMNKNCRGAVASLLLNFVRPSDDE
ncbi:MAG: hypothetical protein ACI83I_002744 [Bacteroidia bacterium]